MIGESVDYMSHALALARGALAWCSPNPAVGAVLVRDGRIVGQGFTQPPGQAHAEVVALHAAGERSRGATLFVTLEPCSHFGRTPPCSTAVIEAGVSEVHLAMPDPSPWVNGAGIAALRAAGVATTVGSHEREARELNEAYFKWIDTGLPFVTTKYAMTADGKIATRTGASAWISGPPARQMVARLRSSVDAVLVGVGTVVADDPQLTARPGEMGQAELEPAHQPLRVILDSTARVPLSARVISGGLPGSTIVLTTDRAHQHNLAALRERGVEVDVVQSRGGRVDPQAAMARLAERGVISVLSEAGGEVTWSLLSAGVVDKVLAFVAPKLVGGVDAETPVEGSGVDSMSHAYELVDSCWTVLGQDALLTGYLRKTPLCGTAPGAR